MRFSAGLDNLAGDLSDGMVLTGQEMVERLNELHAQLHSAGKNTSFCLELVDKFVNFQNVSVDYKRTSKVSALKWAGCGWKMLLAPKDLAISASTARPETCGGLNTRRNKTR